MWHEVYVRVEHVMYQDPPTYEYGGWIKDTIESICSALVAHVIFVVMTSELSRTLYCSSTVSTNVVSFYSCFYLLVCSVVNTLYSVSLATDRVDYFQTPVWVHT